VHPLQIPLTSELSSTFSDWYQQHGILAKGERAVMACEWRCAAAIMGGR
jgi:hypothetical protein